LLRWLLRCPIPNWMKRRALRELLGCTADAFRCTPPPLRGLPFDESLRRYALFTREMAERVLQQEARLPRVQARLRRNAYRLGQRLRRGLGVSRMDDVMAVARALYRIIGIDFRGSRLGEVVISRCFFSQFYTSLVCGVISALDEGILAGLAGEGQLTFHRRITEGEDCCQATFVRREREP